MPRMCLPWLPGLPWLLCLPLLGIAAGCGGPGAVPRANPDATAAIVPTVTPPAPARSPSTVPPSPVPPSPVPPALLPPSARRIVPDAAPADPLPQRVVRPADDRPLHDDAALAAQGIWRVASRRLVLYTDLPVERVAPILPRADALYDAWVGYFGPLPPARDESDFQMTGYLTADRARFEAAGLIPADLRPFLHGRHRGQQFWMNDQPFDYYLAHLALHEATHCFMTCVTGRGVATGDGPPWYLEGMAERFATHRVTPAHVAGDGSAADGVTVRFGIMPRSPEAVPGWGRITLVREAIDAGRFQTLDEIAALSGEDFLNNVAYGWAWAACEFLDTHPAYRNRFRELGDLRLRGRFAEEFRDRFAADARELADGWAVFAHGLRYGYDLERAAVTFADGTPLTGARTVAVSAGRGWVSSGVRVEQGRRYTVSATGTVTLAQEPRPWTSPPTGISFDWFNGRPLGRLLAAVRSETAGQIDAASGLLTPLDVGDTATLTAAATGTLYLRVNDAWDRLGDNAGAFDVTVREE